MGGLIYIRLTYLHCVHNNIHNNIPQCSQKDLWLEDLSIGIQYICTGITVMKPI